MIHAGYQPARSPGSASPTSTATTATGCPACFRGWFWTACSIRSTCTIRPPATMWSGRWCPSALPALTCGSTRTAPREVAPGLEVRPLKHRIETFGYRLTEPDGRTFLPDRLAATGSPGPTSAASSAKEAWRRRPRGRQRSAARAALRLRHGHGAVRRRRRAGRRRGPPGGRVHVQQRRRRAGREYRHLTAGQAGDLAGAGAGTLVLTHFSSRYGDVHLLLSRPGPRRRCRRRRCEGPGQDPAAQAAAERDRRPAGRVARRSPPSSNR